MSDREILLIDYYDVWDYNMSFMFKFVKQHDGIIRIYILKQPSYGSGQATGGHDTHRYGLDTGNPYICFEPMPRDLSDARAIAEEWAKRTAYYIRNGRWFNVGQENS